MELVWDQCPSKKEGETTKRVKRRARLDIPLPLYWRSLWDRANGNLVFEALDFFAIGPLGARRSVKIKDLEQKDIKLSGGKGILFGACFLTVRKSRCVDLCELQTQSVCVP